MQMKSITLGVICMILLVGCGSTPTIVTTASLPSPEATGEISETYPSPGYPIETERGEPGTSESYPAGPASSPGEPHASATPDPSVSPIIIANVTHNNDSLETILISNVTDVSQDIAGYSLLIPGSSEHINFPEMTLAPGESLRVYNGAEAKDQTDGLVWLDQVVLKIPGDSIILLNRAGRMIWNYTLH
jgi:hypothetical protein